MSPLNLFIKAQRENSDKKLMKCEAKVIKMSDEINRNSDTKSNVKKTLRLKQKQ